MKNLLKNKKGFSLAEILLVVAIIVILSGATMIGIASMVNRSQAAASRAVASNANFEADAVLKVNKKKGIIDKIPTETETLNTGNADDTGTGTGDTGTGTGTGDTGTGTGTGDADTGTGTGDADTGTGNSGSVSYGSSGRPDGDTVYGANDKSAASGTSTSVTQKGDQYNACRLNVKIPHGTKSYVLYVPGAGNNTFKSNNGSVTSLGNGYYRITLNWANVTSEEIFSDSFKNATGATVVEYTKP
ncbi:MAG: type II secretion system GspH family protein [Saccharofermentans sp.]|nr:type II secretion system GspH family protein [Saccharofermentans sp.]